MAPVHTPAKVPTFAGFTDMAGFFMGLWEHTAERLGQFIVNRWAIPKELDEKIYYERDHKKVLQYVYDFYHKAEYQNLF